MHWLEDAIWWFMRVAAFVFQLVGVAGILAGAGIIWVQLYSALIDTDKTEVETHGKSETGSREEDRTVQPGL